MLPKKEEYETAYDRKREPCKSCDFSANGRCQRPAFRLLCHEQGAGMVCSEMISAKAILYHNKNTEELMQIHSDEGPVSLQLFGSDPDIVSEMAKKIEERPFSVLDLNMGCPVPKVVNNGEGSA